LSLMGGPGEDDGPTVRIISTSKSHRVNYG
jgi:hypothetical protein